MSGVYVFVLARLGLLLALVSVAASLVPAQELSGSIAGIVKDQQDASISDATVILLDSAAVRLQRSKTDEAGGFQFSGVRPGAYVVEVERAGFARTSISVNVAGPGQTRVSIQLKVVGPGQRVIVTAELSSFRTDESSTAAKMSIPINEIPQGVGVVNQSLIQSQQDIRFGDAAENISGVNRDVLAAGDLGSALTIRGLPLGVQQLLPGRIYVEETSRPMVEM